MLEVVINETIQYWAIIEFLCVHSLLVTNDVCPVPPRAVESPVFRSLAVVVGAMRRVGVIHAKSLIYLVSLETSQVINCSQLAFFPEINVKKGLSVGACGGVAV